MWQIALSKTVVIYIVVLFVPSNAGKMITYFVMNKSRSLPFIIQRFDVCPQMYNDSYQWNAKTKLKDAFFFQASCLPVPPTQLTNNKPNFPYCQSMISMYDLLVVTVWKIVKKRSSILLVFHVDNVAEIAWHVQALFNDCHSIWRLVLGSTE